MKRLSRGMFTVFIVLLVLTVNFFLLQVVMDMPRYGQEDSPFNNYVMERYVEEGVEETGGYNLVSNILLEYRALDTFLETTVIFCGVVAVTITLAILREN